MIEPVEEESEYFGTFDGRFQTLQPTISKDNGLNCPDRVHNLVTLKVSDFEGRKSETAEALCVIHVPAIIQKEQELVTDKLKKMIRGEDTGPEFEEWSLPVKFLVRQREAGGKPKVVNVYLSQQTDEPSTKSNEMQTSLRFNYRSKFDYDKE